MSKPRKLAVLGAGGHGRVVAEAALCSGWDEVEFFDDALRSEHRIFLGPFRGSSEDLFRDITAFDGVVVGVGGNEPRSRLVQRLMAGYASLPVIVHPAASISRTAEIGAGSVVLAGAVVVTGARIGKGCIINTGASVDHDCTLGDWVHVSPGARLAGTVTVGDMVWVGIGAAVREGATIGKRATIGAGSTVVGDIKEGETVVGSPARPIIRQPHA